MPCSVVKVGIEHGWLKTEINACLALEMLAQMHITVLIAIVGLGLVRRLWDGFGVNDDARCGHNGC